MKLSIITINYNNLEGLKQTADSVLSQTWRDFEWILVDGGSTDGSKEFVEGLSKRSGSNISYWCSERDKGVYNAMNKGILKAKAEYCLFLNSGDYLYDAEVLDKVFSIPFTEDVVYGYAKFVFNNNHVEYGCSSPHNVTLRTFINGTIHHSGNSFIRIDAFSKYGLYDEELRVLSDWKWFLKVLGLGKGTSLYINVLTSVYDCNGISGTQDELMMLEKEKTIKELIPPRIMQDYINYDKLEQDKYNQEIQIRNSMSYRVGAFILAPIKFIKSIVK